MTNRAIRTMRFEVDRWEIPVFEPFLEFQDRYQAAVPPLDVERVQSMVAQRTPWDQMLRYIEGVAPFGFLMYWRNDVHPVMSLAEDRRLCVAYLMGNHTIAERMFRDDPLAMLYAPLRTLIYQDEQGSTWFSLERPSTQFSSMNNPNVAAVGVELDAKVDTLLTHLGLDNSGRSSSPTGSVVR